MTLIDKFKKLSLPVKSAIAFTIASFLEKGVSLLTTPVFTRILEPSEFGLISVYSSWFGIITIIATLNLTHGTLNSAMINFEEERDDYLSSTLVLSNVVTIIMFAIYLLFRDVLNEIIQLPSILVFLIFLISFFNPALSFEVSRRRYEYKYKNPLLIMILNSILSPVIAIVLVMISSQNKGIYKIWGSTLVTLVFSLYYYFKILNNGKNLCNKKYWKFALAMAIPLIPHYLSMIVLASSDKIMISNMIDLKSAGFYSIAYTIGSTVTVFWGAINSSLIPWTYEKIKTNSIDTIKYRVNSIILFYSIMCLTVVLFAPEILFIMAPIEYKEAINVIPPVIVGVYFMSLYSLFANVEFYYKKSNYIMFASIISAALNVILNYALIPRYGYIAAAYTTLLTYLLNAIFHYYFMKKIDNRAIYDIRYLSFLSFIVLILSISVVSIYNSIVIRYSLIVALLLFLYANKNKIIRNITLKNER